MKKKLMIIMMTIIGLASFSATAGTQPAINSVSTKIHYPSEAKEKNIEGTVLVYFEIENGQTQNLAVIRSVSASIDEAAIDVVNGMTEEYILSLELTGKKEFVMPIKFDIQ